MDMFSLYHRDRGCFPLVVVPPMFHVCFVCVLHVVSRFQVIMFHAFAVPHLARRAGGAMQGIVENSPLVAGWPRPEPAVAGQRWL